MNQIPERYDRSMRLFGADGQRAIGNVVVVIVGGGGVGSALAQHLALLGVRRITTVEPEELDETNRNRFVGARTTDAVPGTLKVALIDRLIRETNSGVESIPIAKSLLSIEAFDAIKASDWVFGCLDGDGPRAVLNELCAAFGLPYIDLAADVPAEGIYGGRVCVAIDGQRVPRLPGTARQAGCTALLRIRGTAEPRGRGLRYRSTGSGHAGTLGVAG